MEYDEEVFVTLPLIKKRLLDEKEEGELTHEMQELLEYVSEFTVLPEKDIRSIIDEIKKIERINNFQAHKVAEILPQSKEEIRAIFSKEIISPTDEMITTILDIIKKYV